MQNKEALRLSGVVENTWKRKYGTGPYVSRGMSNIGTGTQVDLYPDKGSWIRNIISSHLGPGEVIVDDNDNSIGSFTNLSHKDIVNGSALKFERANPEKKVTINIVGELPKTF